MYRSFRPSILREKSRKFSVRIFKMYKFLEKEMKISSINDQVLRSGTSVYANIKEAEFAQSPADFVHKLSVSLKEANETHGWIEVLKDSDIINQKAYESIEKDCLEIIAMLVASINTTKKITICNLCFGIDDILLLFLMFFIVNTLFTINFSLFTQ